MTTDLALNGPSSGALALAGDQIDWTPVQRAALDHIGIADAPAADQQVFLHVCQRVGLDPWSKQIYMIGRREKQGDAWRTKYTIQTGIDGFRLIAEDHPQYAGTLDPQWCGVDGVWKEVWTEQKPPVAARVLVLRHDRQHPITLPVRFNEFAATFADGNLQGQWRSKPAHMIGKVAEAAALRKAFPRQLAGVYTDDEMAHTDNVDLGRTAERPPAGPGPTVSELTGKRPAPATTKADVEDAEPNDAPGDEPDWDALVAEAEQTGSITVAWRLARQHRPDDAVLRERIQAAGRTGGRKPAAAADEPVDAEIVDPPAAAPVDVKKQHAHMHALWSKAELTRSERIAVTSHLVGREVNTSKDLTEAEADTVIARLRAFDAVGKAAMQDQIDRWLEQYAAKAGTP